MKASATPVLTQVFECIICGEEAGTISLWGNASQARYKIYGTIAELGGSVKEDQYEKFYQALKAGDAATLFQIDLELVPFYCPPCNACYCKDHWQYWMVFDDELPYMIDCTRGRCHRGHERMLLD